MMPGSHYPYIPSIEEQRCDYECGRCGCEVTSATRREVTGDGWLFYGLSGNGECPNCGGAHMTREFALCGDCAAMMRTLQAIRVSRGVGEIVRR